MRLSTAASIGRAALDRLQNECARQVASASRTTMRGTHLRAVEAHQTFLEVALSGLGQPRAAALATLIVRGVGGYRAGWPFGIPPETLFSSGTDGEASSECGWSHRGGNADCHGRLLRALVGQAIGNVSPSFMLAARSAMVAISGLSSNTATIDANASAASLFPTMSAADGQRIVAFVTEGVARIAKHYHRDARGPPDTTGEFSYGSKLHC